MYGGAKPVVDHIFKGFSSEFDGFNENGQNRRKSAENQREAADIPANRQRSSEKGLKRQRSMRYRPVHGCRGRGRGVGTGWPGTTSQEGTVRISRWQYRVLTRVTSETRVLYVPSPFAGQKRRVNRQSTGQGVLIRQLKAISASVPPRDPDAPA